MAAFLTDRGFRSIAPSRPGYLGTVLDDSNSTPDQQAELMLALMDSLRIERFGLMCWSGGGPSSYRLAVNHPDRVSALVALAAVSERFEWDSSESERLLAGRFGKWMLAEMASHTPKKLVSATLGSEGDLSKGQLKELAEYVFNDPAKRDFVVSLSQTVADRKVGLANDQRQFALIEDLELDKVQAPTLLVHGSRDSDVPLRHSEFAASQIHAAQLVEMDLGTHICVFADPSSAEIQANIALFLAGTT